MINPKQLFKAGREKKILEVKDDFQVNDFWNNTGFQNSSLHGKMSRISFFIIDITKGKKKNAVVCKFSFTATEIKRLVKLLEQADCNGGTFTSLCNKKFGKPYFAKNKVIPYIDYGNGFVEVRSCKISYEANMRSSSKWKIELHKGKAKTVEEGIGFDKKTYSILGKSYFFLTDEEMLDLKDSVSDFIPLWEQWAFPKFMENRVAFMKRAKKNNYSEETINVWNNNSNSNSNHMREPVKTIPFDNNEKQKCNNNIKAAITDKKNTQLTSQLTCIECGNIVTKNVAQYSKIKFGQVYCPTCYNKNLKNAGI